MCGLFGFNGSRAVDLTKLRWLAVQNESRGRDSAGVYGKLRYRQTGTATGMIKHPEFTAAVRGSKNVIGHTRSATTTDGTRRVDVDNAHPHIGFGKDGLEIIGAHNGWIIDEVFHDLVKRYGFEKAPTVDSMLIYWILAKEFPNFDVLGEIEGAIALNFTIPTRNPDRLYLYKRQSRVLHIGQATDGIYYSSEEAPLELIGCSKIFMLPDNYMWVFENGELIESFRIKDPKIKSIAEGASKSNWDWRVPQSEYSHIKNSNKTASPHERRGSVWSTPRQRYECDGEWYNFQNKKWSAIPADEIDSVKLIKDYRDLADAEEVATSKKADTQKRTNPVLWDLVQNRLNDLMVAIRQEDLSLDTIAIDYKKTNNWDRDDLMGSILITTLLAQNNQGLAAWAVYDEDNPSVMGVTGPWGSTAVYFPPEMCGKPHKITISGPLDSAGKYEFEYTPNYGRVMEVALDIPFQKGPSKFLEIKAAEDVRHPNGSSGGGQIERDIQHALDIREEVGHNSETEGADSRQLSLGEGVSSGGKELAVKENLPPSGAEKNHKNKLEVSEELIIANIVESNALYLQKVRPLTGYATSIITAEKNNPAVVALREKIAEYPHAKLLDIEKLLESAIKVQLVAVDVYKTRLKYLEIVKYLIVKYLKTWSTRGINGDLNPHFLIGWISSLEPLKKKNPKPNLPLGTLTRQLAWSQGVAEELEEMEIMQENGEIWEFQLEKENGKATGKGVWTLKYRSDSGTSFLDTLYDPASDDLECSEYIGLYGLRKMIRQWSYKAEKFFQIFKCFKMIQLPDGWLDKLTKLFKGETQIADSLISQIDEAGRIIRRADDKKTPMFITQTDAKKVIFILSNLDRYMKTQKTEYDTMLEELNTGHVEKIDRSNAEYAEWAGI